MHFRKVGFVFVRPGFCFVVVGFCFFFWGGCGFFGGGGGREASMVCIIEKKNFVFKRPN